MADACFDYIDSTEFKVIKNSYRLLQYPDDNSKLISANDLQSEISNLIVRSKKFYSNPTLKYFKEVHVRRKNQWFLDSRNVKYNEKQLGTDILLNQPKYLSGFEFLFGFYNKLLFFASKAGVLAIVGLGNPNQIEKVIKEYKESELEGEESIFVCIITLFFYDGEIKFVNDVDKIIYEKVRQSGK